MEKVTDKWFKDHGWKKYVYKSKEGDYDDQPGYENCTKYQTQFYFHGKNCSAHVDCYYYVYHQSKYNKKKNISRFYTFYAIGKNGFTVDNNISYRKFTVDQIESALKIIGS